MRDVKPRADGTWKYLSFHGGDYERGGGSTLNKLRMTRTNQISTLLLFRTAKGNRFDPSYLRDWRESFKDSLGGHRSAFGFGKECPTDAEWGMALHRIWFGSPMLPPPLGAWKEAAPR